MNWAEFENEAQRLSKTYNERNYPAERLATIFKAVQSLSPEDWRDIVSELIAESREAPMKTKILEIARPYMERAASAFRDKVAAGIEKRQNCSWCGNSGFLRTQNKNTKGEEIFRCSYCDAAGLKGLSRRILAWESRFMDRYWPKYVNGALADDIPEPTNIPPRAHEKAEPAANPAPVLALITGAVKDMEKNESELQEVFDL